MTKSRLSSAIVLALLLVFPAVRAQVRPADAADPAMLNRIWLEGTNNSRVMEHLSWITDVFGPRIPGSPAVSSRSAASPSPSPAWPREGSRGSRSTARPPRPEPVRRLWARLEVPCCYVPLKGPIAPRRDWAQPEISAARTESVRVASGAISIGTTAFVSGL